MPNKLSLLKKVAQEISRCRTCRQGKSGKPVPGEGDPDAKVVFIGEAPGKQEAKVGRSFIGRSGKLLREQIRKVGLIEDKVFITSPVKYLPDRGIPTKKDILHGRVHLFEQLKIIDPKIFVLLGSVAVQAVFGKSMLITQKHGLAVKQDGKLYFITFHPAAALRFRSIHRLFIKDFQKLRVLLTLTDKRCAR